MLTAITQIGRAVFAGDVERAAGPFLCPGCHSDVILKKGQKHIHHFAHRPDSVCELRGESVEHMAAKWGIYQALRARPEISRVELEFSLPGSGTRADVMFRNGADVVAVEIQRSRLCNETILQRIDRYTARGVNIVWVCFPLRRDTNDPLRVSPQSWQRMLHTLYYGRLYEWAGGATVCATHLNNYGIYVEAYEDHYGSEYGGYEYSSKRYRTIMRGPVLNLIDDFVAHARPAWRDLPPARLWKDTAAKWWFTKDREESLL